AEVRLVQRDQLPRLDPHGGPRVGLPGLRKQRDDLLGRRHAFFLRAVWAKTRYTCIHSSGVRGWPPRNRIIARSRRSDSDSCVPCAFIRWLNSTSAGGSWTSPFSART